MFTEPDATTAAAGTQRARRLRVSSSAPRWVRRSPRPTTPPRPRMPMRRVSPPEAPILPLRITLASWPGRPAPLADSRWVQSTQRCPPAAPCRTSTATPITYAAIRGSSRPMVRTVSIIASCPPLDSATALRSAENCGRCVTWTEVRSSKRTLRLYSGRRRFCMAQMDRMVSVAAVALAAMAPNIVPAQALSDQWQFGASIYGWLPSIRGNTTFPAGSSSVSVDASQIVDHLKFVGMGTFSVQKDRWGAFTDFIYLDVGASKSGTRDLTVGGIALPAGVSADASLDIKSSIWTLAGSYRVLADPGASLDVFAGARSIEIKQNLRWQFSADIGGLTPPPRSGANEVKLNNVDGIVGAKGRYAFGAHREWDVPY